MTKEEMAWFRVKLIKIRDEIIARTLRVHQYKLTLEEANAFEKDDVAVRWSKKDRFVLGQIGIALVKIREGRYGICEDTGKPIDHARLRHKPWARFGNEVQERHERERLG